MQVEKIIAVKINKVKNVKIKLLFFFFLYPESYFCTFFINIKVYKINYVIRDVT